MITGLQKSQKMGNQTSGRPPTCYWTSTLKERQAHWIKYKTSSYEKMKKKKEKPV